MDVTNSQAGVASSTAAVILNYRTPHAARLAVESLLRAHSQPQIIIVVDNASGDDSLQQLRSLSRIRLLAASSNGGFSAGCNLGIAEAVRLGAGGIFLLNSDATVEPDTLGTLERALEADPRLGIVGPVIISSEPPHYAQSLGISYSLTTARMWHRGFGRTPSAIPAFERVDVAGVSGCAMLIRRTVIERIGLLPEEYFFGFEDLDYCLRARAAGFRIACVGGATVRHAGSLSMGRHSGLRIYYGTRNHLLIAQRFGWRTRPLRWLRTATVIGLNLAHALTCADVPTRVAVRGFLQGFRDHLARRYGAAPSGTIAAPTDAYRR